MQKSNINNIVQANLINCLYFCQELNLKPAMSRIKRQILKLYANFKAQSQTSQAFIILIILLLIGILLRWSTVINGIVRGFRFYSE